MFVYNSFRSAAECKPLINMAQGVISRRRLLAAGTAFFGATVSPRLLHFPSMAKAQSYAQGGSTVVQRNAGSMIVYSERYVTREMPVSLLRTWVTPVEHFFVRNNELMPQVDLSTWRLSITGEVMRPFHLSFNELTEFASRQVTNTLECAGNGRVFFQPPIGGVPWSRGGVGNAVFAGPTLASLLRRAGLKTTARHVAFRGLDVPPRGAEPFVRSIPVEKAMAPDTLVATQMNGLPLSREHGYPARILVPGWIGSASIKWLSEIRAMPSAFHGYQMDSAYRLPKRPIRPGERLFEGETEVITSLPVKSIIAQPADGSEISMNPFVRVRVFGAAWAGESSVSRVEISTDGGGAWSRADWGSEHDRYAWRLWSFDWRPARPGVYSLMSRATDNAGRSQPLEMAWNPQGYLWNAVDQITVRINAQNSPQY
jgi:DMSO/TMAO reductase YedYZ molybdopterin-dependent catalytic subunit